MCKTDAVQGPQDLTVYGKDRVACSTCIGHTGDADRGLKGCGASHSKSVGMS